MLCTFTNDLTEITKINENLKFIKTNQIKQIRPKLKKIKNRELYLSHILTASYGKDLSAF